jgi:hypothetical protein
VIDPSRDAFGAALLDYLEGRDVPELVLEEEGGEAWPATRPEWFFRGFEQWDWWDREILPLVARGPVLDLGAGSWEGSRRLLTRLAELAVPGAVLVGDSVTPDGSARVLLRIRYRDLVTPWWPQYNIPATQMAALVDGTGWGMEMHLRDGDEHAVLLRRT